MTDPRIEALRAELTENDLRIVAAVNTRVSIVERLRQVKEELGLDFVDPGREQWLLDYLGEANSGPLSDDGLRRFVSGLLELTKREVYGEPAG